MAEKNKYNKKYYDLQEIIKPEITNVITVDSNLIADSMVREQIISEERKNYIRSKLNFYKQNPKLIERAKQAILNNAISTEEADWFFRQDGTIASFEIDIINFLRGR